jgi:hypothetical protein
MRCGKFIAFLVLLFSGCSAVNQPVSRIVQKAQACGAGELSGISLTAVQDWFGRHRACAVAVDGMCTPVRANAVAAWTDSTEGRVCVSARNVAQWVRKPASNHEAFRAGWK